MTEIARVVRVNQNPAKNPDAFLSQLNQVLSLIADQVDKIQGHRGTPEFYAAVDLRSHRIQSVAGAVDGTDAVILNQMDAKGNIGDLYIVEKGGEFYFYDVDSNLVIIHVDTLYGHVDLTADPEDVTASRSFGTVYQNTNSTLLGVGITVKLE